MPLFPIVQDQWLNIFLLNEFQFSFYLILYFLSGFLFPILVINNSLINFFDYKFYPNKYQNKKLKFIGYHVILTLLILSIFIIRYLIFSISYIIPQININIYFGINLKILCLLIIMILLLIKKTKRIIKKLFLINFFIISFINWACYILNLQGIEIYINKYISNNSYYQFNNLNIVNISCLFIFEILYYLWSFISYQNNLSDWSIRYPTRLDFIPILKISFFYLGVLNYYIIFNRISY